MLRALLRVSLMTAMQYRASFLAEFFTSLLTTFAVVLPVLVVYTHTDAVAGWSRPEALLVTGFFMIFSGLVATLIEPNLGAVVDGVRTGSMDYLLVKPVDAQLVVSLQKVDPAQIWGVIGGFAVLGWGISDTGIPTLAQSAAAAAMLIAGLAGMYGLWILVVCLSFWFVRVDNLRYLLQAASDAGRWPVSVYRGWVRFALTVLIPVAVVTSWPALALLGKLDLALAGQAVAVGVGMLVVSRIAWLQALRFYTSASS